MEDKLWIKFIYLPFFIQCLFTLGTVALLGGGIFTYFISSAANNHTSQLTLLQNSLTQLEQRLDQYRQREPNYVLTQQLTHLKKKPNGGFPVFILSYGSALSNWQEGDSRQKASLLLGWLDFLQFWEQLIQLERNTTPSQLELSALNGLILINLTYEKK